MPSATETRKTTKTTDTKSTVEKDKALSEAEKRIADLEAMVQQLLSAQKTAPRQETKEEEQTLEINPNKKTKITSLCYGRLSLYCPQRGFLNFDKFGDTRILTYAQLVDYVNSCRKSAEQGLFYIHNKDMVEDLSLSESYKNIINESVLNDIFASDSADVQEVLSNVSKTQKQTIADLAAQKVYNKELTDIIKISKISEAVGVNILDKVKGMEETEAFVTKQS